MSHDGKGFGVVIPARFASKRLPGKPLRDVCGKPMIVRVYENARRSGAEFVVVATDDARIAAAVEAVGGEAVMTSSRHVSGTDRIAEVVERKQLPSDFVVVNVQGDEPLIEPELISRLAGTLAQRPGAGMATLATPIRDAADLANPNVVKVVLGHNGRALYFSRAPVPWARQPFGEAPPQWADGAFQRHVGLYAYRGQTVRWLAAHPPVAVEQLEALEQLRALWLGIDVWVEPIDYPPWHGVDTEEDLQRVVAVVESNGGDDDDRPSPSREPLRPRSERRRSSTMAT